MAKVTKKVSLKNCFIDSADPMTVQEIGKDECKYYDLMEIVRDFANIEGVSISISVDNDLPESDSGGETE